ADLEHILAGYSDLAEPGGTPARDVPCHNLAGFGILDVHHPANVRVDPEDLRQHAFYRGLLVLIELRLSRVMRERGHRQAQQGDNRQRTSITVTHSTPPDNRPRNIPY